MSDEPQNLKLCFNSTDLTNFVEYKTELPKPIIIPENKDYEVKIIADGIDIEFRAQLYFYDERVTSFGYANHGDFVNGFADDSFGPYWDPTEKYILPKIIKDVKILFEWNPYNIDMYHDLKPELFPFKDFKVEFYFVEKLPPWVENDQKEECCICFEETLISTRCQPVRHYVCEECFRRITNCPYCRQKVKEED
jgi:hypothetical protein